MEILASIGAGLIISLSNYISKSAKGESFDILKFIRTFALGAIVGGVAKSQGIEITAENYQTYVAANGGIVAVTDQVVKLGGRLYQNYKKPKGLSRGKY